MTGQNANEGVLYASPWSTTESGIRQFARDALPDTSNSKIDYIVNNLYPFPPPNSANVSSALYTDQISRTQLMVAEAGILCHSATLAHAFRNKTYNYLFSVPPAFHASDLAYTFFDHTDNTSSAIPEIAATLQSYFLNFVRDGNPNGVGSKAKSSVPVEFEKYGEDAWTLNVMEDGFEQIRNPGENGRCDWWRSGFYEG